MLCNGLEKLLSIDSRGKFGRSGGFGKIRFGYVYNGFHSEWSGIYNRKKTLKGWQVSRMTFYRPTNPQTVLQQSWRTTFANGMSAWSALTEDEKNYYRKYGKKYKMNGSNVFMRWWLENRYRDL